MHEELFRLHKRTRMSGLSVSVASAWLVVFQEETRVLCNLCSLACEEDDDCPESAQFCELGKCNCRSGFRQDMAISGACERDPDFKEELQNGATFLEAFLVQPIKSYCWKKPIEGKRSNC